MTDNRNTILAVILSGLVLIGWQYFFNIPQMEKQRAAEQTQSELAKPAPQAAPRRRRRSTGAAPAPISQRARRRQPSPPPPRHRRAATPRLPLRRASRSTRPRADRQHCAEGRAHRRPVAGAVPRDRRSDLARDRAVLALGHRRALLRRIRLGPGRRLDGENPRPEHGVAAGRLGQPDADHAR